MYYKSKVSGGYKSFGILAAIIIGLNLFVGAAWLGNAYKLVTCDWDNSGSWKGEIVHAIGLVPYVSLVTVWNNDN
jgi:hypothetical protein